MRFGKGELRKERRELEMRTEKWDMRSDFMFECCSLPLSDVSELWDVLLLSGHFQDDL